MVALDVDTPFQTVSVTGNYTCTGQDILVMCDPTNGAITVTLPVLSGVPMGHKICVAKNGAAHGVTVACGNNDRINNVGFSTLALASGAAHSVTLISAAFTWIVFGAF